MKAESAMAYPIPLAAGYVQSFQYGSPTFSLDDFEGNIVLLVLYMLYLLAQAFL